jgi:hypothetical protein
MRDTFFSQLALNGPLRLTLVGMSTCLYCGAAADSVDHTQPQTVSDRLPAIDIASHQRLVPACRECNTLLGPSWQGTLQGRKRALAAKLRKRYRKLLQAPDWTDAELDELGETLRSAVAQAQAEKRRIRERLRIAEDGFLFERQCPVCLRAFWARNERQVYCASLCRQAAFWQQKRDAET